MVAFQCNIAGEIFKMGNLVQHFMAHKSHNSEMSVFDFVDIHYLQETKIDEDFAEDMSLPFKSSDNVPTLLVSKPTSNGIHVETITFEIDSSSLNAYEDRCEYSATLQSIWQPPRA